MSPGPYTGLTGPWPRDPTTGALLVSASGTAASGAADTNARLLSLGSSDRQRSMALARAAYEDAVNFSEPWANLTAWSSGTAFQVSAGRAYSSSQGANAGNNHSFAIGSSGLLRAVTTLNYVGSPPGGGVLIGVTSDTAGGAFTSGATTMRGLYFDGGGVKTFDKGTTVVLAASPPIGTYVVTIVADANYLSVIARKTDGSVEYRARFARAGYNINNLAILLSDTRNLSGSSVGPFAARKALATNTPRTGVEDQGVTAQWSAAGGNNFKVELPTTYDSRIPSPLAICFHGHSSDEHLFTDNSNQASVANALLADGYIVLTAAQTSFASSWGAQGSLDAYYAAYKFARDNYAIGPVVLVGVSMGGLEAFLTLAERRIPGIVAMVGLSAAANLADNFANAAFTSTIKTAYGIAADGSDYAAKTVGHDPVLKTGDQFRAVPMLLIAATDDTTVPKATNTDVLAALVAPYSPSVTVTPTTGGHSFTFSVFTSQITAFLDGYVMAN